MSKLWNNMKCYSCRGHTENNALKKSVHIKILAFLWDLWKILIFSDNNRANSKICSATEQIWQQFNLKMTSTQSERGWGALKCPCANMRIIQWHPVLRPWIKSHSLQPAGPWHNLMCNPRRGQCLFLSAKTIECWAFVPFGKRIMEFERGMLVLYGDRDWMEENVITIPVYATMANHLCRPSLHLKKPDSKCCWIVGAQKPLSCYDSQISVFHSHSDKRKRICHNPPYCVCGCECLLF